MSDTITIKISEQGQDFHKRYPKLIRTYQSLPGMAQDYDIDWDLHKRGAVKLDHGKHSITINHVLGLQTFQDLRAGADDGLTMFTLITGLTNVSGISHDAARLRIYEILRGIEAAGWKNLIDISSPRLNGRDRLMYILQPGNSYVGLDTKYLPTLLEWMQIENGTSWNFYADGLYMNVHFRRSSEHMDPNEQGVYQLKFNIKTDTEYFRGFAGPDMRDHWKAVLPDELSKVAKMRADKEAELRAKGIAIDESYQDPPVPKLD